jgi:hypothetical protein
LMIKTHWIFKPLAAILYGVAYLASKSPESCGEYMWAAVFDTKKGFSRRGEKGEDIGTKGYSGTEEAKKLLWDHTVEITKVGT